MIHCTTYTTAQGNPVGYFVEFHNVTEEHTGKVTPVYFAKSYPGRNTMLIQANNLAELYTQGLVFKTEILSGRDATDMLD